jgi:Fe-S-cluster containining protein
VVIGTTFVEWADKTRWVAKFNGSSYINVVDESGQSYSGHVFVDRLEWDDGDVWFREVPEVVVNESNSGSSHLKNGGNSTVQSLKVTKYTSAVDRSNAHARKGHKTKNESHHQHHAASHSRAHSGERTGQQAESDCKDTADGAVVVMKGKQFDCSLYEAHPLACNAADFYDDSDFTAAVMCCSCGGGSTGEAHGGAKNGLKESSTISTTRKDDSANANAECRDTNGGAVVVMQGESYDCALYDAHPLGCKAADFYDDTDFTAGDMCCGCGGGSSQSSDSDTSTTGEEVTASQVAVQVNSSSFLSRK